MLKSSKLASQSPGPIFVTSLGGTTNSMSVSSNLSVIRIRSGKKERRRMAVPQQPETNHWWNDKELFLRGLAHSNYVTAFTDGSASGLGIGGGVAFTCNNSYDSRSGPWSGSQDITDILEMQVGKHSIVNLLLPQGNSKHIGHGQPEFPTADNWGSRSRLRSGGAVRTPSSLVG